MSTPKQHAEACVRLLQGSAIETTPDRDTRTILDIYLRSPLVLSAIEVACESAQFDATKATLEENLRLRELLAALVNAANYAESKFGDEYAGRLGALYEARDAAERVLGGGK